MLDIMIGVALETAAYDGALDTAPGARYHIINKPRRPTNPPKQAHCSLRTRRGAAESGSKAAVGLLRWIGGSRGLLIINITSRVRGKVSISIYGILCKGGLRDLK